MNLAHSGNGEVDAASLRHMKIQLDDPLLVDELVHHLRRSGCVATPSEVEAHGDGIMVDVRLPGALDPEQERMEIELYLRVFEATHPGKGTRLLG
jgi:hypothetical protein